MGADEIFSSRKRAPGSENRPGRFSFAVARSRRALPFGLEDITRRLHGATALLIPVFELAVYVKGNVDAL